MHRKVYQKQRVAAIRIQSHIRQYQAENHLRKVVSLANFCRQLYVQNMVQCLIRASGRRLHKVCHLRGFVGI